MKVSRVAEMRDMDRRAVSHYGIVEDLLMENAGEAAYFSIAQKMNIAGSRFAVICGSGNNGGDGLVIARKLHSMGGDVTVFLTGSADKYKNAALRNYRICAKLGIRMDESGALPGLKRMLGSADLVIDAIFGTGLERDITGNYKKMIDLINQSRKPVMSVDIPSGVNGDTGQIMGAAVKAVWTVSFGLPKTGNLLYPGYALGGELYTTHISFPPEMTNAPGLRIETNDPLPLPERSGDAHKGSCGKVLFIAGSSHYLGAPYFAAGSFLKSGGGLSFLATPEQAAPFIASRGSEIILLPQAQTESGSLSPKSKKAIMAQVKDCNMVVVGPGLSLDAETQGLTRDLIAEIKKPLLIDGDGLSAIAKDPSVLAGRSAPTVITPHPGEMARLLGVKISDVEKNRLDIVIEKAREWKSIIVLKGAHTLIAQPDGTVYINLSGNPGMATAGSGDVLCGVIAGMLGIGFDIESSVRMGVFVHGFSGDLAAEEIGEDGVCASDIMAHVPAALRIMRDDFAGVAGNCYQKIILI